MIVLCLVRFKAQHQISHAVSCIKYDKRTETKTHTGRLWEKGKLSAMLNEKWSEETDEGFLSCNGIGRR